MNQLELFSFPRASSPAQQLHMDKQRSPYKRSMRDYHEISQPRRESTATNDHAQRRGSTATDLAQRSGSSTASRRSSMASRRSPMASRRSSVDSTRRSPIQSYDSILASLPAIPFSFQNSTISSIDMDNSVRIPLDEQAAEPSLRSVDMHRLQVRPRSGIMCEEFLSPDSGQQRKKVLAAASPLSPKIASNMLDLKEFEGLKMTNHNHVVVPAMSNHMPFSEKSQTVVLRSYNDKDIALQTIARQPIGTLEYTPTKESRVLRDAEGNICAIIFHTCKNGQHKFKICCDKPMDQNHRISNDSGYYTWAEVKNSSGLGVKFSMKLRGEDGMKYVTESFGPSWLKLGSPRGFLVKQGKEGNACSRITNLGDSRGIVLGADVDVSLVVCFAAVVDEMVENRMR